MTDLPMEQPIVVNPGNTVALLGLLGRNLGVVLGGTSALVGFASHRDLAGFAAWLSGDELLPLLGALLAIGSAAWSAVRLIRNKRRLVIAASAAPDHVAVVKGDGA